MRYESLDFETSFNQDRGIDTDTGLVLVVGVALAFVTLGVLTFRGAFGAQNLVSASVLILLASLALTFVAILLARLSREKVAAAEALRESEARYRLLANHAADMILAVRADGLLSYASPSTFELLGYNPSELVGSEVTSSVHPEDAESLRTAMDVLISGADVTVSNRQRYHRKDGGWVWTEAHLRAMPGETGQTFGCIVAVRDISEHVRIEEQLQEMSTRDGLTGVGNSWVLELRLSDCWGNALRLEEPLSLLLIDVDNFRQFNDQLGHLAGDQCLKQIGRTLIKHRRASDFVARIAGDSFVVLLPATDRPGALAVADAVRSSIEEVAIPYPASPINIVTVSIGAATLNSDGLHYATSEALMADAERALHDAKQAGRNRVGARDSNSFQTIEGTIQAMHRSGANTSFHDAKALG